MIVYKCDRCGAYYDKLPDCVRYPSNDPKKGLSYQGVALVKINEDGNIYGSCKYFMLCEDCMTKLVAFLEHSEKDELKEQENIDDSQTPV